MPIDFDSAPLPTVSLEALPSRINALIAGQTLTLVGLELAALRACLETASDQSRHLLVLDLAATSTVDEAIARVLDDLAALALAAWPAWYGGVVDPPGALRPWHDAARRLAAAGRPPRFQHIPAPTELSQLLLAIDPDGLILVAAVDPVRAGSAAATIAALEWCARNGAAIVALCATRPTAFAPYDRILYDALEIETTAAPIAERLILPRAKAPFGSAIERRVREALARDEDLGGLFESEVTVPTKVLGVTPRVDMLWRDGRVVIELDGPEHFGGPTYGHDRHRDYALLVSGYLVLRLTNTQIATDLDYAIDQIRKVVRFRRSEGAIP